MKTYVNYLFTTLLLFVSLFSTAPQAAEEFPHRALFPKERPDGKVGRAHIDDAQRHLGLCLFPLMVSFPSLDCRRWSGACGPDDAG